MANEADVTSAHAGFFNWNEVRSAVCAGFAYERIVYSNFRAMRAPPKWAVCFLPQLAHEAHVFFVSFADMVGKFRELQKNYCVHHQRAAFRGAISAPLARLFQGSCCFMLASSHRQFRCNEAVPSHSFFRVRHFCHKPCTKGCTMGRKRCTLCQIASAVWAFFKIRCGLMTMMPNASPAMSKGWRRRRSSTLIPRSMEAKLRRKLLAKTLSSWRCWSLSSNSC